MAWLREPVSPLPTVVFRVGFGLLLFVGAVRFVLKGWVEMQYLEPSFHFSYLFFDWVRPLPGPWLYAVFLVQMASALLIAAGRLFRPAAILFFLSFTYVELLEKATYLNHYYFVSLVAFLLVFLPMDRRRIPRWVPLALRSQVAIVYLFAGVAKLNAEWLFAAEPLGIWLRARSGVPVLGFFADQGWLAYAMSWAGAAFDLSVPFLLSVKRTRPWAYLAVIGFHVATAVLFPIGMFPWIMIASTLVFFEGDELRRIPGVERLGRGVEVLRRPVSRPGSVLPGTPVVLLAFFALQLLIPLRHLVYPGSVLWTEEGYRFSWRVMLAEKSGFVVYRATDPDSGRSWEIYPGDFLTPLQEKQMSFQPDMILEFAHHLRDLRVAEGHAAPEIRADAFVSLNARPAGRLVDPTVDLAALDRGLAPMSWIRLRAPGLPQ